jgi:hypothetical protein
MPALQPLGMFRAEDQGGSGAGQPVGTESEVDWPDGPYVTAVADTDIETVCGTENSIYGSYTDTYTNIWEYPDDYESYLDTAWWNYNMRGREMFEAPDGDTAWWTVTCSINYNDEATYTLITGGAPDATGSALYEISAQATSWPPIRFDDADWFGPVNGPVNVPSPQITVGGLGALCTNGFVLADLPLHQQINITPTANGTPYYWVNAVGSRIPLLWQCVAPVPTNQNRTTLGVGEQVNFSINPPPPCTVQWSVSGGGTINPTNGTNTTFTAPGQTASSTVTATVIDPEGKPHVSQQSFTVIPPTGVTTVKTSEDTNPPPAGYIFPTPGAGMHLLLTFQPTSVSFGNVQDAEVSGPASNVQGIFTNISPFPFHASAGWIPLNFSNQMADHAAFNISPGGFGQIPYPSGGSAQLIIPNYWRVGNSSTSNFFQNFTQTFSMDVYGTVTVTKLGQSVSTPAN